jgi:hypothetical protein
MRSSEQLMPPRQQQMSSTNVATDHVATHARHLYALTRPFKGNYHKALVFKLLLYFCISCRGRSTHRSPHWLQRAIG